MKGILSYLQMIVLYGKCFVQLFFGNIDQLLIALCIIVTIHLIVALLGELFSKRASKKKIVKSIIKILYIFMLVGVANTIDNAIIGEYGVLRTTVICFYLAYLGLDILRKASHFGLPIPKKLEAIMLKLFSEDK